MDSALAEILIKGATGVGVNLDEAAVRLYLRYLGLLLEWNQKINLTAITDPKEIVLKHFVDSISVLPYLEKKDNLRILDVGSGAGFPGLPIKIACAQTSVVLLDSLNKRLTFLNNVISELDLSEISTVHGRAEDLGRDNRFRGGFDVVASRAVAKLSVLVELCIPFVRVGGIFVAYKGPKATEEMSEAQNALRILGGQIVNQVEICLPGLDDCRTIIFIKKKSSTPDKYPRKAGMPDKKPL